MNKLYKLLFLSVLILVGISGEASGGPLSGQNTFIVKGKVTDSKTAEPIIGATVIIKGTNTGVVTDINGDYSIDVKDPNARLEISYVGYNKIEIGVENRTEINISLEYKVEELEQVVVIGYGTTKKADLVGAISSVSSKEINNLMTTNVSQAIQGRVSGVEVVNSSGAPGASVRIKIRGTGTVNNSDPLYVVDGFIVEDIKFLNPEDIKDFQVLKDASSSAIYGARAANGVVLITTKRGEKGEIKVVFSANYGTSELWRTPERTNKEQFKELAENAYNKPMFGTQNAIFTSMKDKVLYYDFGVEDWTKYVCKTGVNQKYNLQVSGGNDKNVFLASGTWANDEGVFLTSKNNKSSLRFNMDNKLNRFLTLKSDMSVSSSEVRIMKEEDLFKSIMSVNPLSTYYDANRIYVGEDSANHETYGKVIKNEKLVAGNPYSNLLRHNNTEKTDQYKGDFDLETKISNGIINNTRAGFSMEFWEANDFWANDGSQDQWNGINAGGRGASNVKIEKKSKYKWQLEDILTFSKEIENHNILMLSGISLEGYTENYLKSYGEGAPGIDYSSNALDANFLGIYVNGSKTGWRTVGIPVRFDYNYSHKYFFQANCRADASSKFRPEKRWGFFPSLSVGWTVSEEQFMKNIKTWLTQLKIRGNWGKSGNNRIDDFSAYTILITGDGQRVVFGRNPMIYSQGWSPETYGNPTISWEKTTGSNIGLDWSILKGSISGSFDVFDKTTSDMLLKLPLPLSFGPIKDWKQEDITPWQNAGSVNNSGYEITLTYKKTVNDFAFEIRGNYSHVANKITKLGEEGNPVLGSYYDANGIKQTYLTYSAVNNPIGMFYGWKIDKSKPGHANGIWQTSDAIADGSIPATAGALPKGSTRVQPGDFIYTDMNGDGVIDEQDKTFLGSPFPKATYGLNLNFRFKNVELTAFFQGVYGNKLLNTMRYYSYSFHGNSTAPDLLSRSWKKGVNESTAEFPINTYLVHDNNNYRLSDFYIEDGSYLRLKNLELSYIIPKKWIEKAKIKNMRVSAGTTNLMTWTKYTGFDPEIGGENISIGVDKGTYPQSRTFMGSISIEF